MKSKNEFIRMSGKVSFDKNILDSDYDQINFMRVQVFPPIMEGMKRVEVDFNISQDGTVVEWKTLDVDINDNEFRKHGITIK